MLLMATAASSQTIHRKGYKRGLVILAIVGVGLYLIVPQVTGLGGAWDTLAQAEGHWLMLAALCLLITYPLAALVYCLLALRRLPFGRTTLLQVAGMFAGRLLPAGVGALGVNYLYLRKQRHTTAQAGAVVAANNALGFIGNVLLVAGLLLLTNVRPPSLQAPKIGLILLGVIGLSVVGLALTRKTRLVQRLLRAVKSIGLALLLYRKRPVRLLLALLTAILLTSAYAVLLYACARAIGVPLSFGASVIVMTVGVAGATATPTPGGIGGAEAALAAALALYGVAAVNAVAIAVLYRLITYWLGLVLGGLAVIVVEQRKFI